MSLPVKLTCTPQNIFGPVRQHLFLGCSVISFTTSIGFNGQSSELTVNLAIDQCVSQTGKVYYDSTLSQQLWYDADPGFYALDYSLVGHPVYFRFENFEFSGFIQSFEKSSSSSGEIYIVKLIDPVSILEHAHCIIGSYAGSVASLYNTFNCFGYAESFGTSCPEVYQSSAGVYNLGNSGPDGAIFGSPAAAYGGSDTNHSGMKTSHILGAIRLLTSSYPAITNVFSPYGRLVSLGSNTVPTECMGLMGAASSGIFGYYLDLSELPTPPSYFRENGVSITIFDLISKICTESGHDFFFELVPVVDSVLGAGIHKFIKLRTINRNLAPALNSIDTFLSNSDRKVVSYTSGQELRNEVTSTLVIGGPKQSFYQVEQSDDPEGDGQPSPVETDDMIIPFFGVNPANGNVIIPTKDADDFWEFNAPTYDLALQLANPPYNRSIPTSILINEKELMNAKMGYDAWLSYASLNQTDLYLALNVQLKGLWDIEHLRLWIKNNPNLNLNKARAADFVFAAKNVFAMRADPNVWEIDVLHIAYAWLNKFVEEYYGKTYQVRLPFTCARLDTDSNIKLLSEEPSDGGYTEVTPILGLSHPSIYTDMFLLQDNRLGSFVRFDNSNGLESVNLNINEFISYNNQAWVKVDVESNFVFLNSSTLESPRVVIKLPQSIHHIQKPEPDVEALTKGLHAAMKQIDNVKGPNIHTDIQKRLGSILLSYARANQAVIPDAAGFGIKSNILTYGPWGSSGVPGGVNIIQDDSLVPWEYGGFTNLNTAANQLAVAGVTNTQIAEEGSITVAGFPNLPLGAELLAADAGGPFDGGGTNLVENRTASTSTYQSLNFYYTTIYPWDGTFGPNVTGITVQVGENGFTTTYSLRTWTPKFGRYAKYNADRLKTIGQNRVNLSKQLRMMNLRHEQNRFINRPGLRNPIRNANGVGDGAQDNLKTPHEVFAGELIPWNNGSFDRTTVMSASVVDLGIDVNQDDYTNKAFMSLDGLIRPIQVSRTNDYNLPRFATPSVGCQETLSHNGHTPMATGLEDLLSNGMNQYNVKHSINYLNPFVNPIGFSCSEILQEYGQNSSLEAGHDIEILGRGTGVPPSSMIMPIEGYGQTQDLASSDYTDDYRAFAIRGPLLIHGWGFDLDGKPVPNVVDVESTGGIFETEGLKDQFLNDWLRKPKSWPVAPFDLRYDRQRAVWTIPEKKRYKVQLISGFDRTFDVSCGGYRNRATGIILRDLCDGVLDSPIPESSTLYDSFGNNFTGYIEVSNTLGYGCMSSGDIVSCEYNAKQCLYDIIGRKNSDIQVWYNDYYSLDSGNPQHFGDCSGIPDGIFDEYNSHSLSKLYLYGGIKPLRLSPTGELSVNECGVTGYSTVLEFGINVSAFLSTNTAAPWLSGFDCPRVLWEQIPYTNRSDIYAQFRNTFTHNLDFGFGFNVLKAYDTGMRAPGCRTLVNLHIPVCGDNLTFDTGNDVADITIGDFNSVKLGSCLSGNIICGADSCVDPEYVPGGYDDMRLSRTLELTLANTPTLLTENSGGYDQQTLSSGGTITFIRELSARGCGIFYKTSSIAFNGCGLITQLVNNTGVTQLPMFGSLSSATGTVSSIVAIENGCLVTVGVTECPSGTGA